MLVPMIRESKGMKMSSLRLVDNQQPCANTNEQSEDMAETEDSDEESELEKLQW
jgi:hypothetical protein